MAFWPGAVEADWGSTNSSDTNSSSIHPCNATTQQDLVSTTLYIVVLRHTPSQHGLANATECNNLSCVT